MSEIEYRSVNGMRVAIDPARQRRVDAAQTRVADDHQTDVPKRTARFLPDALWRWLNVKEGARDQEVCELLAQWKEAETDHDGDAILDKLEELRVAEDTEADEEFQAWARSLVEQGDPLAVRALEHDDAEDWKALSARYADREDEPLIPLAFVAYVRERAEAGDRLARRTLEHLRTDDLSKLYGQWRAAQ